MATTTTSDPFSFPREYSFPAFFTRQTNLSTHAAQLQKWSSLVLAYTSHHRIFSLSLSSLSSSSSSSSHSSSQSSLFHNRAIDRRLSAPDIREVISYMVKEGRAEWQQQQYSSGSNNNNNSSEARGGGEGKGKGGGGDLVWIWWRKPEEWASLVEAFVEDTGQKGGVLTVYELSEGDATRGTELFGMDRGVLLKALNILVKRGKAQIFGQNDSQGVKFF